MPGAISRGSRSVRGKPAATSKSSASITNFTRISKLQTLGKDVSEKAAALETGRTSTIEIVLKSRKRSADESETVGSSAKKARREPEAKAVQPIVPVSRKSKTVTFAEPETLKTPLKHAIPIPPSSRKRSFQATEITDASASEAESLLERLNIQSSPIRKRSRTIRPESENDHDLPPELLDLLNLHIAFLKTLTMSYAHNGASSPVDLRNLLPSVSQSWGKRQVTQDDVRLLVGVLNWSPVKVDKSQSPFFLSDYGRGKICIESQNAGPGPLREKKLNMDFESNLRTLWISRRNENVKLFLATLPKTSVKNCVVTNQVLAKGQRTLMELKNGVVRKQQQQEEAKAQAQAAPTLNPDGSKMSLLDRIRFKELQQSQTAQGPSPAELMRRAALQRAEDIAAVIRMLCMATSSGQARVSFTMAALMLKIKESLRNPISVEDGTCCVRLLATEIAPQWMRIVTIGGRENVVLQTAFKPTESAIQERVKSLLG
ncbi:hypothetical protein QBC34DRAFT_398755 [Podospora aff. communis PSN243]|uniref:DNA replication factor Cdt1 C-terminal domain-containing protein n=1 Tax=Podospora aff. communis PSN243 TaxID=3040156 RepID=A0AAV9GVY4_9PEZI|nr:hypothetical protein QBC34DRAFT_398755 [Podospora aff. communis PSN243]